VDESIPLLSTSCHAPLPGALAAVRVGSAKGAVDARALDAAAERRGDAAHAFGADERLEAADHFAPTWTSIGWQITDEPWLRKSQEWEAELGVDSA
jgi:hypothetical protein